jgi:hypothetical protein
MHFRGKALYNLLKNNWLQDQTIAIEPWQVEDYRSLSIQGIFKRLRDLDISLNEESFLLYAENCEAPEELLEFLWTKDEDAVDQDKAYLLLFELWRRLLPERRSLSIFCDEMDERFERYDLSQSENEESIQNILQRLEDILDENVDLGGDPKEVFQNIQECCAHDVESFIYDFIAHQIQQQHEVYASELLDGFYGYIQHTKWFDFLRARLFALSNPHEGNLMIAGLLELLEEEPDFDLLYEIASYLVYSGDPSLFIHALKQAINSLKTEGDFQDLLHLSIKFFQGMDHEEKTKTVQIFLLQRRNKNSAAAIDPTHPDVHAFLSLLDTFSLTLLEDT